MLDTEHKIDEQEDTASAVGSPHLNSGTRAKRETVAGGNSTPDFSSSEDILDVVQRKNSKILRVGCCFSLSLWLHRKEIFFLGSIIFLLGKYFS